MAARGHLRPRDLNLQERKHETTLKRCKTLYGKDAEELRSVKEWWTRLPSAVRRSAIRASRGKRYWDDKNHWDSRIANWKESSPMAEYMGLLAGLATFQDPLGNRDG